MTNIQLKVIGATATATVDGKITSGMVGLPVSIEYDESWDGLSKTAFFRAGGQVRKRTSVSDRTTVPWEILRNHSKRLEIGIEGRNASGDIVIPTVWATVGTIKEGASGDILAAPLPNKEPAQGGGAIDDSIISYENTWSSKNTVDKLCPSFAESGPAVTCEPVEGYPLTVQTDGATKVYRGGKNQFNVTAYPFKESSYIRKDNGNSVGGASAYCATPDYIPVHHLRGSVITLNHIPGGDFPGMAFYNESKAYVSGGKGSAITVPANATYMRFTVNAGVTDVQIEIGQTATKYEQYRTPDEFAPGEAIPALDGVNTIWADSGDVTVTGKADPRAVSRKQDERIAALEATMTALLEG